MLTRTGICTQYLPASFLCTENLRSQETSSQETSRKERPSGCSDKRLAVKRLAGRKGSQDVQGKLTTPSMSTAQAIQRCSASWSKPERKNDTAHTYSLSIPYHGRNHSSSPASTPG
eukprot:1145125-Pelagomonas_calceolata.AAC.10